MEKRTSVFENGLIWFGAAVSIAEIMTGTLIAPLGFKTGVAAIVLGHIIGCFIMFMAGYIGGKTRKSAMETVAMSFGNKGKLLFAVLNIVQLVGWTAIMIYDGAIAAGSAFNVGNWVWCIAIGGLIILWILIGIKNLGRLNTVSMACLFILTIVLSFVIFSGNTAGNAVFGKIGFGAAVELSASMPLSWMPLISDYTREAQKPVKTTVISVIIYGVVSCWMYIIGMGAAVFTGSSDIAGIMTKAGLGVAALFIIILSTVTTTFLDAYSAGVSSESISSKISGKWLAAGTAVIGVIGAVLFNMTDITEFLYFIGSVFAPMIAIQIADFFILKNDYSEKRLSIHNLIIWGIGFVIYRHMMKFDFIIGTAMPSMIIIILVCVIVGVVRKNMITRCENKK